MLFQRSAPDCGTRNPRPFACEAAMGHYNRKATREEMAHARRVIKEAYPQYDPVFSGRAGLPAEASVKAGHDGPALPHDFIPPARRHGPVSFQRHLAPAGLAGDVDCGGCSRNGGTVEWNLSQQVCPTDSPPRSDLPTQ